MMIMMLMKKVLKCDKIHVARTKVRYVLMIRTNTSKVKVPMKVKVCECVSYLHICNDIHMYLAGISTNPITHYYTYLRYPCCCIGSYNSHTFPLSGVFLIISPLTL